MEKLLQWASCPRTNEFNVMCPSFPSKWPNSVPSQTLQRAVPKVIIFHNCSTTKHELHAHKSVVLLSNRTIANKPKILLNVTDNKFYGQSSLTRCFPVTIIFRDAWNNQLKNKKRFLGYQREKNWGAMVFSFVKFFFKKWFISVILGLYAVYGVSISYYACNWSKSLWCGVVGVVGF